MQPIPDVRLTCVSNFPIATYSGMLPGVLADLYPIDRMEIDLVRLCAAVNARLIVGNFTGLDIEQRQLLFEHRPALPFDVLSIGIGSRPARSGVEADDTVLEIKPMQTFLPRLEARVRELVQQDRGQVPRVVVVGAGVGGVEIALCLPNRLNILLNNKPFDLTLVGSENDLARGTARKTQELIRQEFESRGVHLRLGKRVSKVAAGAIVFDDGESIPADIVLWATGATAPPALNNIDLPKDAAGFLLTRATLQTKSDAPIFAVGDTGTIEGSTSPKAGVYAVRQAPILWENIARQIQGRDLLEYRPQQDFLKLMNLGDGRAIAEYKGATTKGWLAWRLKDWIDGRFMDKYQDYKPMEMAPVSNDPAETQMRCAGCGSKVSGSVLSHVLARLDIPKNDHVLLGLDAPDDAAIIKPVDGRPMTVTADFFSAPLEDAYLSGRIAALNSASDLFALGAQPIAALALATLPLGKPRQQEQLLYELLAGSLYEFRQMGATLVGGHTIEGPQVTIGFTMLADQGSGEPRTKNRLRAGDVLILTKPLGTGVLLAAHMQADCRSAWMQTLLESMLLSNQPAASLIDEFDIAALTDITGFGLAGHLLEMLTASDLACELQLERIPLLPGVAELIKEGVESTLAPANRAAEIEIKITDSLRGSPAYQVVFDPQTSGGLLLAVREEKVDALLRRLAEQSNIASARIGVVRERVGNEQRIRLDSKDS
jgi:selenide,water dikinase